MNYVVCGSYGYRRKPKYDVGFNDCKAHCISVDCSLLFLHGITHNFLKWFIF